MTTLDNKRARRSSRPTGDERQRAILDTAERLLRERAFTDISVDDLAKGAGLSRPTFYFYFASKDAVLLTLFEQMMSDADTIFESLVGSVELGDPLVTLRTGISAFFTAFGKHRAVTLAGAAAKTLHPEFQVVWSGFMQRWVDYTALLIEAERERGNAPTTLPAVDIAVSLNLMNERAMYGALANEPPAVADEKVVDTLAHIWFTAIYGRTP
ncbi:HTH-type transcriptional regulator EthR [Mycolicibacterium insubricum]|uniref:TetR family transcriptional regulator n=1 Tax=Mycolicibacterium insubricum TaxID=444597 RepID=A0A1X0D348_9MYCO|nr:TetR/AcrR family transcriptional regulator [Mycolicibacterium insubricum]MCB9439346.1 TetR/AcrR family transcriptional regulator [Mycolicibacterium sp.]MCV7082739.1 TetR/AcrR family transcriptional regulator [Mycolicibacterium insubricum]ORA66811.1 TetR family transcriptional regulator [Mycolicibacterium insubricum]BBZ65060.1 HTH-type transcriptional regulator EthR [Mycolicibacterium insubricum]